MKKTNKPYIKIKYNNNKEKYISYDFEKSLTLFLKKVFSTFFKIIIIGKSNGIKVSNVNQIKLLDINVVI